MCGAGCGGRQRIGPAHLNQPVKVSAENALDLRMARDDFFQRLLGVLVEGACRMLPKFSAAKEKVRT